MHEVDFFLQINTKFFYNLIVSRWVCIAGSGDFVKNFCFIANNSDGSNNISVDSENVINHNRNCNGIDSDNVRTNNNGKVNLDHEYSHIEGNFFVSEKVESGLYKNEKFDSGYNQLKDIKLKNINRISIDQININSLRNKFEFLSSMVNGFVDILPITECKQDDSFPTAQLHMQGYSSPFRLDRNSYGGGILPYMHEDIPSKPISNRSFDKDIKAMFVEINLFKEKEMASMCLS